MRTLNNAELTQVEGGLAAREIVNKAMYIGAGIGTVVGALTATGPERIIAACGGAIIGGVLGIFGSLPFAAVAAITE